MNGSQQLLVWSYSHFHVLDIRHFVREQDMPLYAYRLPANCFLYVANGEAMISLGDVGQRARPFLVLHGVKGSYLTIDRIVSSLDYYLVFYGASLPEVVKRRLLPRTGRNDVAAHQCYSVAPVQSGALLYPIKEMYAAWESQSRDKLQRIRVTSLLYQFVYELLQQVNSKGAVLVRNDVVTRAISYIEANYSRAITLDELAGYLDCSSRHLSRTFKSETGSSPIEFLIDLRMAKAKELLVATDATLQDIAEIIGQNDSYYFSKMFKKYVGVSPVRYRNDNRRSPARPYLPSDVARYGIGDLYSAPYSSDNDYHYYKQGAREGNSSMYRNNKLAAAMLLGLTLVLSACSGGNGNSEGAAANASASQGAVSTQQASPSASPESATTQAYQASIETKFGTVEINAEPKRIVALGWGDAETVLSLGVQPIGASDWVAFGGDGVGPWLEGSYQAPPTIIGTLEPDYEMIASLKPDLILDVKSSGDEERYKRLSEIATTVGIPEGADRYKTSSEDQLRIIAKALNKEEEGEALIAKVNDAFAKAASEHPEFAGKTAVVGSYQSSGFGAYVTGSTRIDFVTRLGFIAKPEIEQLENTNFAAKIADERLELLDADLTVIVPIGVEPNVVTEQTLFQKIPSVADGRALVLDRESSRAFSTGSIPALLWTVEHLVPQFAQALNK